jgi:hypothetical protein
MLCGERIESWLHLVVRARVVSAQCGLNMSVLPACCWSSEMFLVPAWIVGERDVYDLWPQVLLCSMVEAAQSGTCMLA